MLFWRFLCSKVSLEVSSKLLTVAMLIGVDGLSTTKGILKEDHSLFEIIFRWTKKTATSLAQNWLMLSQTLLYICDYD